MAKVLWSVGSKEKLDETFTGRPAQMQLLSNALADTAFSRKDKIELNGREL